MDAKTKCYFTLFDANDGACWEQLDNNYKYDSVLIDLHWNKMMTAFSCVFMFIHMQSVLYVCLGSSVLHLRMAHYTCFHSTQLIGLADPNRDILRLGFQISSPPSRVFICSIIMSFQNATLTFPQNIYTLWLLCKEFCCRFFINQEINKRSKELMKTNELLVNQLNNQSNASNERLLSNLGQISSMFRGV